MEPAMTPRLGSVTLILNAPTSWHLWVPHCSMSHHLGDGIISLIAQTWIPSPHISPIIIPYLIILTISCLCSDHCSLAQMDSLPDRFEECPCVTWKS